MRKIIRTSGEEIELAGPMSLEKLQSLIDAAEGLDFVSLHHLGAEPLHIMCVDDRGYETEIVDHGDGHFEMRPVRSRKPVNPKATALYHANCRPGTVHVIVGDVAIVYDEDFK